MQFKHVYKIDIDKFKSIFSIENIKGPFIKIEGIKFPIESGKIETGNRLKQLDKYLYSHKNTEGFILLEVIDNSKQIVKEEIEVKQEKSGRKKKTIETQNEIETEEHLDNNSLSIDFEQGEIIE